MGTLQELNISRLGNRNIIFKKCLLGGYVNSLEGIFLGGSSYSPASPCTAMPVLSLHLWIRPQTKIWLRDNPSCIAWTVSTPTGFCWWFSALIIGNWESWCYTWIQKYKLDCTYLTWNLKIIYISKIDMNMVGCLMSLRNLSEQIIANHDWNK